MKNQRWSNQGVNVACQTAEDKVPSTKPDVCNRYDCGYWGHCSAILSSHANPVTIEAQCTCEPGKWCPQGGCQEGYTLQG